MEPFFDRVLVSPRRAGSVETYLCEHDNLRAKRRRIFKLIAQVHLVKISDVFDLKVLLLANDYKILLSLQNKVLKLL